jgi:hypothetical protein
VLLHWLDYEVGGAAGQRAQQLLCTCGCGYGRGRGWAPPCCWRVYCVAAAATHCCIQGDVRRRGHAPQAQPHCAAGLCCLQAVDVLPHLRALQQLAEDKVEVSADTGELAVTEPRKLAGLGLVNPPAAVVKAALRAGVRLAAVRLPLSVGDVAAAEVAGLCRQHGIQVLATGALLEGLMSDVWLGVPCPGECAQRPACCHIMGSCH